MNDATGKLMSSGAPQFLNRGFGKARTLTYPKNGQEQSPSNIGQGPWLDRPKGSAMAADHTKSGQKQSVPSNPGARFGAKPAKPL